MEVEVEYKGEKKIVKLRRITFGEYIEIVKKAVKSDMIGNTSKTTVDTAELMRLVLQASMENKDINVNELDAKAGLDLAMKAMELNGLTEEKFFQ